MLPERRVCPICKKSFVARRPDKRCCSPRCSSENWLRKSPGYHYDPNWKPGSRVERKCLACGKTFTTTWKSKKCCSYRCSQRNWNNRNKGKNHFKFAWDPQMQEFLSVGRETKTLEELGRELGCTREWIRQLCIFYGVPARRQPRGRLPGAKKHAGSIRVRLRRRRIGPTVEGTGLDAAKDPRAARFLKQVKMGPLPRQMSFLGRCWLWTGPKAASGGGVFQGVPADLFSYRQEFGDIPEGTVLRHLCEVPSCVNPAHLYPGSGQRSGCRPRPRGSSEMMDREGKVL
jgi:hypothetical protein